MKKPVDERRAEILEATVAVVRERGFAATRVQDVARRMGVSTGLIHYHFDHKDALLAEAFAHAARLDLARFPDALAAPTALDALARAIRLYAAEPASDAWAMWIDAWGAALRNPRLRDTSRTLDLAWMGLLLDVVERGAADGEWACADPAGTAWRLAALVNGLAVESVVHPANVSTTTAFGWIVGAAATELGIDRAALDAACRV